MVMSSADTGHGLSPYRLPQEITEAISEVAKGVDEGEAGLKSCANMDRDLSAKVSKKDAVTMHVGPQLGTDDIDDYLNEVGDYLAKGFSFDEVAKIVKLNDEGVKLLDLERWCSRVGLRCDADEILPTVWTARRWTARSRYQRRTRARRTLTWLREYVPNGATHTAVLHIVYGWPDPFLRTIAPEARVALGPEYAPLARYTDAVEAKRQELVKTEAAKFDDENVVDLERRRSRHAWADRIISSGDALRAATDDRVPKKDRAAFVTAVRIDANRMLTEASVAFVDAWRRQA